ncbi:MAG TPA: glycosyltransferase family 39 protein [Candidatus Limnocylindrales bacterium]|nr:glycosyltransferase family 39 protein [Candidatus Limnocylindrales bacterium]
MRRPRPVTVDPLGLITIVAWVGGVLAIAAMAWSAVRYLLGPALRPWSHTVGLPRTDLVLAAAAVATAAALLAAAFVLGSRRPRAAIALAIGTLVVVRLGVAVALDARLFSDYLAYRSLAEAMIAGYGFWTSVPPGYPLLEAAGIVLLGGAGVLSAELVNVALGIVSGVAILVVVRDAWGDRSAAVAVMAFAIIPSQVFFTLVLGTEIAYGAALALVALVALRSRSGSLAVIAGCGVLLGLSQYVRPTSQLFLPAVLAVVLIATRGRASWWRTGLTFVVAFAVSVAPIVAWNASVNGRLSASPSLFDKWTVYIGLNAASHGQYRLTDRLAVSDAAGVPFPIVGDGQPGTAFRPLYLEQSRAFNDAAGNLIGERLRKNGFASVRIQPAKFAAMWDRADYPIGLVFGPDSPQPAPRVAAVVALVSQAGWVALLITSLVALVRLRRTRPPAVVTVLLILLSAIAIHVVAEVQPRYHEYYVPLLVILVGGAVAAAPSRPSRRPQELGAPAQLLGDVDEVERPVGRSGDVDAVG